MPTFGDFETYGEPLALTEERGHVSTIWQARKIGGGNQLYVIKCYAPRPRAPGAGPPEGALARDRALEFLEGVKQLKKANAEGGRNLAPILDLGKTATEAWYATDHYPRNNLKVWIARRGGVDSAALRHVVRSVVAGCLALKHSRGYSHGNLKPSNIFLVGQPRPLKKTPLALTDAYPAAPLQLAALGDEDRSEVGELLSQVVEAQDLRNLGELLLQLVEGRLLARSDDYNYPVQRSSIWEILGKDADDWLKLCNQLVNPQLSLGEINLEALAQKFRSSTAGWPEAIKNLRQTASKRALVLKQNARKPLLILGIAVAVCIAGIGVYKGVRYFINKSTERDQILKAAVTRWTLQFQAATNFMNETNFSGALAQFKAASDSLAGQSEAQKQDETRRGLALAEALSKTSSLVESQQFSDALVSFEAKAPDIKQFAGCAQWVGSVSLARGRELLSKPQIAQTELAEANRWAKLALLLTPANPAAESLRQDVDKMSHDLAEKPWREFTNQQPYREALAAWTSSGVASQLEKIVRRDFDSRPDNRLDLSAYALPDYWRKMSRDDQAKETAALTHIAEGDDPAKRDFAAWKQALQSNYGPLGQEELASAWVDTGAAITNKINEVMSGLNTQRGGQVALAPLQDDLQKLEALRKRAQEITAAGQAGGQSRERLRQEAAQLLAGWPELRDSIGTHLMKIVGDRTWQELKKNYPWFTGTLRAKLTGDGLADVGALLPGFPAKDGAVPPRLAGELDAAKANLRAWWSTNAVTLAALSGLPLTNTLWPLLERAQPSNSPGPDFSGDEDKLLRALQDRSAGRRAARQAADVLHDTWGRISGANLSAATANWQKVAPEQRDLVRRVVQRDFEAAAGTNTATLEAFTNAVAQSGKTITSRIASGYYSPPELINSLGDKDRKDELSALSDVARGTRSYGDWREALNTNYNAVGSVGRLVTGWDTLGFAGLSNSLALVAKDVQQLAPPYNPRPAVDTLQATLAKLSREANDCEVASQKAGTRHSVLAERGHKIITEAGQLKNQLTELQARIALYQAAMSSFGNGDYAGAMQICQTNDFSDFQKIIEQERAAYQGALLNLSNCNFSAVLSLQGPLTNKPDFRQVIQSARDQDGMLSRLRGLTNQPNSQPEVKKLLGALSEPLKAQPCFRDFQVWVESHDPLAALKSRLDCFKVWFGLTDASDKIIDFITHKRAAKQPIGIDTRYYLQLLKDDPANSLKVQFERLGPLPPEVARDIKTLEDRINNW